MATRKNAQEPAQVPGDAESPPKGEQDPVVKEGVRHPDKTEPEQTARTIGGDKKR